MLLKDCRGLTAGTASADALVEYEAAIDLALGYWLDPIARLDRAVAHDPGFVLAHVAKGGLLALVMDPSLHPQVRESLACAEANLASGCARARAHVTALRRWVAGDFADANHRWGRIAIDWPRDALAMLLAHTSDFMLGRTTLLRDRPAAALPYWGEDVPGMGYLLGMYAFGLEENGAYGEALDIGRRALRLNARDPWAVHAITHVLEMQGRFEDGIAWLAEREPDWAPDNGFAFHLWWHRALYHLDAGDVAQVLSLHDQRLVPHAGAAAIELIDPAALLWRLHLRGVDVGGRWQAIADAWTPHIADGHYAFNDMHAVMAMVGAGRLADARNVVAATRASFDDEGSNAEMAREVGYPVVQALLAFGEGRYRDCATRLCAVRGFAHRFGGSHAQRDVLQLTALEAALRGGDSALAHALAAERRAQKPHSPANYLLWSRLTAQAA